MGEVAKLFTRSLMMGLDSSVRKEEFAELTAEDIENLPYAEAVEYLKKRDVIKKVDYDKLSDKMRFRAFTASRINDGKLLERLNAEMIANVHDGKGLKDFLSLTKTDILDKVGMGPNQGWYWETVYRTNVQTAYNAGRAMGFAEDKPTALEFVGIDDARQTDVCHSLMGIVRPYDDPFWQTHFPPLHFNCRSTVRAIYDEDELPEEWSKLEEAESPAKGFGKYPLDNDSWWNELDSQVRQAKYFGVQGEIEAAKEILVKKPTGARSRIVNKLDSEDVIEQQKITDDYYEKIRNSNNSDLIKRIAQNANMTYADVEKIINHIFISKHHFQDGRYECFYPDPDIVKAFERLRTGEHTDTDIILLMHEYSELTFMKNKKYNIYEIAHKKANEKFNWQEALKNENVQKER